MAQVGIVMGSDSDMPIMAKAADILDQLGVSYEMTIISAHREPDVFFEYAKSAEEKGFKVIIAGAGMAAHLPGMCAAIFPMPVIGIPMHTTSLGGRDSLYSIVQMPSGIPVATVAINGGANAGLLAAKILATSDDALLERLKAYSEELKKQVEELRGHGITRYCFTGRKECVMALRGRKRWDRSCQSLLEDLDFLLSRYEEQAADC